MKQRTVAIVGGGTAGHVYPALAIAEAYQRAVASVDLLFIGTPEGCEGRLVPQSGYHIEMVEGSPLFGVPAGRKLGAAWRLVRGMIRARQLLKQHRTQLVIGLGGYASGGALLAARSLGLRTAIHESNIVPGLTNTLLGRLVDRVYLGFEAAGRVFPKQRKRVIGNPVRPEVAALAATSRRPPEPASRAVRILVTGGSQGALFLNQHAPELLRKLSDHHFAIDVRHQVGDLDPAPVAAAYESACIDASVVPYIEDMAAAYTWADFAIARSGSATIAELAIAGLPALLVPLPSAASDHQTANAAAFAAAGGAWWIPEKEWAPEVLAARIAALLSDAGAWLAASNAARNLATPDAARALVADCEAMLNSGF